jgi:hypothetical protein
LSPKEHHKNENAPDKNRILTTTHHASWQTKIPTSTVIVADVNA